MGKVNGLCVACCLIRVEKLFFCYMLGFVSSCEMNCKIENFIYCGNQKILIVFLTIHGALR